jgi:hypothetical protein
MDVGSVATSLVQSNVAGQVNVGVLHAVLNLDRAVAAELFASLGLGQAVDVYA